MNYSKKSINCKDCVNYEACKNIFLKVFPTKEAELEAVSRKADGCSLFKPKSRFVELPCAFGDVIYMLVTRKTHSFEFKCTNGKKMMVKQQNQHTLIKRTSFMESNFFKVLEGWGKTVFPSRELAEEALKEREKE